MKNWKNPAKNGIANPKKDKKDKKDPLKREKNTKKGKYKDLFSTRMRFFPFPFLQILTSSHL